MKKKIAKKKKKNGILNNAESSFKRVINCRTCVTSVLVSAKSCTADNHSKSVDRVATHTHTHSLHTGPTLKTQHLFVLPAIQPGCCEKMFAVLFLPAFQPNIE